MNNIKRWAFLIAISFISSPLLANQHSNTDDGSDQRGPEYHPQNDEHFGDILHKLCFLVNGNPEACYVHDGKADPDRRACRNNPASCGNPSPQRSESDNGG